jgi:hypothetical protein
LRYRRYLLWRLPLVLLLPSVFLKYDMSLCAYMPLLKKNDAQDALKREGNTTHIDVFAPARPEVDSSSGIPSRHTAEAKSMLKAY